MHISFADAIRPLLPRRADSGKDTAGSDQVLVAIGVVTEAFSALYVTVSAVIGFRAGAALMTACFALLAAVLLVFRRTGHFRLCANLYLATSLFVAILGCSFFSGGPRSMVFPWFAFVPIASVLLLGMGIDTKAWTAVTAGIAATLGALALAGFQFPVRYDTRYTDFFNTMCVVGLLLILVLVAHIFGRHRRQVEESLRQHEAKYRALFESANDGIFVQETKNFTFIDCNGRGAAMYGLSPSEVVGRSPAEFAPPTQADGRPSEEVAGERIASALGGSAPQLFEWRFVRRDGTIFDAEISLSRIDVGGETFLQATVRDVSERKRNERALQQERQVRETIVESIPGIFYALDTSGQFIFWNKNFEHVTERSEGELTGLNALQLFEGEQRRHIAERIGQVFVQGESTAEADLIAKSGRRIPYFFTGRLIEMDGKPVLVGAGIDISALKQAEAEVRRYQAHLEDMVKVRTEELRVAKDAAVAANVAKSAFLANMSHEIRTPLHAISGMTHLIKRSGVTAEQDRRLDRIEAASRHLLEIINDILDLSRIEADKLVLAEAPIDIPALVEDVRTMVAEQAAAKGIVIETSVHDMGMPLLGDATRVRQALLNYASNAVKFTERGSISIRASVVEAGDGFAAVRFEVADTGVGIPAEALPRLFSAFEQADNSTTRRFGGTGLGLAIAKRLARLMDGDVGVTSIPGVGSTFWFSARLKLNMPKVSVPTVAADSPESILKRDYAGLRILVAEDDDDNRYITETLLRAVWAEIDLAEDGVEAVDLASRNNYDIILMDMRMPRMDGLHAARRIRQLPDGGKPLILALTANVFPENKAECIEAGMNDLIPKGTRAEAPFEAILDWLRRTGR